MKRPIAIDDDDPFISTSSSSIGYVGHIGHLPKRRRSSKSKSIHSNSNSHSILPFHRQQSESQLHDHNSSISSSSGLSGPSGHIPFNQYCSSDSDHIAIDRPRVDITEPDPDSDVELQIQLDPRDSSSPSSAGPISNGIDIDEEMGYDVCDIHRHSGITHSTPIRRRGRLNPYRSGQELSDRSVYLIPSEDDDSTPERYRDRDRERFWTQKEVVLGRTPYPSSSRFHRDHIRHTEQRTGPYDQDIDMDAPIPLPPLASSTTTSNIDDQYHVSSSSENSSAIITPPTPQLEISRAQCQMRSRNESSSSPSTSSLAALVQYNPFGSTTSHPSKSTPSDNSHYDLRHIQSSASISTTSSTTYREKHEEPPQSYTLSSFSTRTEIDMSESRRNENDSNSESGWIGVTDIDTEDISDF